MKQNILKSRMIVLFFALVLSSNIFSQQTLTIFSQGKSSVLQYKNTSGDYEYEYNITNDIGRENGSNSSNSNSDSDIYRSEHPFGLGGIPSTAIISDVKLWYAINGTSSSSEMYFKITETSGTKSYGDLWSEISSGDLIIDDIDYSMTSEISSSTLKSKVEAARSNNSIYIGALSQNEGTNLTDATVELRLIVTYTVPVTTVSLTAMNDMDGYNGGNIGVGVNTSATPASSPFGINDVVSGTNISLQAIENQSYNGYNYIWNDTEAPNNKSKWEKKIGVNSDPISYNQSATYPVASTDNGANLVGYLKKVCNLTFTNSFNGISETGSIEVNGTIVTAPTAQYSVIDGNTIQVEAIAQTYNDIIYTFSHWSDGNTQNPRIITASSHANISAVFVGTPIFTNLGINNRNLYANIFNPRTPNQFITLYWSQHQSSNVTAYKIRRGANINNVTTWSTIATVSGSTTSYTDSDFFIASSSTGSRVDYDVLAYYSPDQTFSNNEAIQVYGIYNAPIEKIANSDSTLADLPTIKEYALNSNFPNPFNPTTQISYQIPENSFVNLIVYNSLGQKISELVNQHQSSGRYSVQFNAADLPSGVYIYKLQVSTGSTSNFSDVKKMLLTK